MGVLLSQMFWSSPPARLFWLPRNKRQDSVVKTLNSDLPGIEFRLHRFLVLWSWSHDLTYLSHGFVLNVQMEHIWGSCETYLVFHRAHSLCQWCTFAGQAVLRLPPLLGRCPPHVRRHARILLQALGPQLSAERNPPTRDLAVLLPYLGVWLCFY